MFFFFFSSRRRHTRLQGDWSSDVCSSDLGGGSGCAAAGAAHLGEVLGRTARTCQPHAINEECSLMTSRYLTSTHAVTSHPTRGRHRRPRATAVASQRVLAGAALGSLMTLGTAAAPAFAGTHATSSQGAAQSDPDGMQNAGTDKPGGTGGVNKTDQDDNNGTGTPGSCDAHASNEARTATRSQQSDDARASSKAHTHTSTHARVAAGAQVR